MTDSAQPTPLCAGVAWSGGSLGQEAAGYEAEVLDAAGRRVAGPTRWTADRVAELIAWLRETAERAGRPLVVVVDSTNGLLDGPMTAAGLDVRRADPWTLPPRPPFGSVPPHALAGLARTALSSLSRLTPEGGTLTGRGEEYLEGVRRSAPVRAALTAAGRCVEHGRRDRPQVALTFDDGPDPVLTRRILDVLARYDARATFFCVGHHVAALPDEVRRTAAAGHELGNHSWSHPFLPDLTPTQLSAQVERTSEAIERLTGRAPTRFRPPYGSQTPEVLRVLATHPTTLTFWDVDSRDWARPGPDRIAATVLDAAGPGSVVLMHEGGGDRRQTVQALPAVIEGLLARGLEPVTLEELLRPAAPPAAVPPHAAVPPPTAPVALSRRPAASPAGPL
ncbi:polysaccharide deacetylase family protein [Streptacidiphilus rugosus]|uniref:polysaccharide deacetylase family protein n=1 Tax=Streptacidiphilus rugosus TaxID=405783 RepID=UPI0007C6DAD8|nr:polysaccharide deacetylase family protein [Streptacidiphilus rugosus]